MLRCTTCSVHQNLGFLVCKRRGGRDQAEPFSPQKSKGMAPQKEGVMVKTYEMKTNNSSCVTRLIHAKIPNESAYDGGRGSVGREGGVGGGVVKPSSPTKAATVVGTRLLPTNSIASYLKTVFTQIQEHREGVGLSDTRMSPSSWSQTPPPPPSQDYGEGVVVWRPD